MSDIPSEVKKIAEDLTDREVLNAFLAAFLVIWVGITLSLWIMDKSLILVLQKEGYFFFNIFKIAWNVLISLRL